MSQEVTFAKSYLILYNFSQKLSQMRQLLQKSYLFSDIRDNFLRQLFESNSYLPRDNIFGLAQKRIQLGDNFFSLMVIHLVQRR